MGKRLIQQRRGRGSQTFRSPGHRFRGAVKYARPGERTGVVRDLIDDPGHTTPLAVVRFEDGSKELMFPPEGLMVGQTIAMGAKASPVPGNVLPLKNIPVGSPVFNIENTPGDGGKFARASGSTAFLITHGDGKVTLRLPSKRLKVINDQCRATIGVVAGGGRKEKPFVKAGTMHIVRKAQNRYYPRVSGVAMNPCDHPFGGGNHPHPGKPKTVSRHAPPGRKVGSLAAKRTGARR